MKILIVLLFLVSCAKRVTEYTNAYGLPDTMKDCKIYRLDSDGLGTSMKVVYCPHANVTIQSSCGKSCTANTQVIVEPKKDECK